MIEWSRPHDIVLNRTPPKKETTPKNLGSCRAAIATVAGVRLEQVSIVSVAYAVDASGRRLRAADGYSTLRVRPLSLSPPPNRCVSCSRSVLLHATCVSLCHGVFCCMTCDHVSNGHGEWTGKQVA